MSDSKTPPGYQPSESPVPQKYKRASGNYPALRGDLRKSQVWTTLSAIGGVVAVTVAVLAWGQAKLDAGVQPVKDAVAQERADRKEADGELRTELREGIRAVREDLRAAQRGQPLPPLPSLDGGTP